MIKILAFSLLCSLAVVESIPTRNDYKQLYGYLGSAEKYPPNQGDNAVEVTIGMDLVKIREVDDVRGEVEIVAYMSYSWENRRMEKYVKDDFRVGADEIWTPDIVAYNQVTPSEILSPPVAVVSPRGQVNYIPSTRTRFTCDLVSFAAWQSANCTATFGSWAHDSGTIDLKVGGQPAMSAYAGDSRFDVLGLTAERVERRYDCCPETYVTVNFIFTLKKKSAGYVSGWF